MILSPRRLLEMKHGGDALLHSLGADESVCLSQLPFPGICEAGTPRLSGHNLDAWRFGAALAESFLKFIRPAPSYKTDVECMGDLSDYLEAMPNEQTRHGFLCGIETLLCLALLYPERLPLLIERLDRLDNAALQEQATRALCFEPVGMDANGHEYFQGDDGGIFAGLTDAARVRP